MRVSDFKNMKNTKWTGDVTARDDLNFLAVPLLPLSIENESDDLLLHVGTDGKTQFFSATYPLKIETVPVI